MEGFNLFGVMLDGYGPAKFLMTMLAVVCFGIWRGIKDE
jgi:hypothetical protein